MINVVVLISGNGSNLQAMIDATEKSPAITITAVISNEPDAFGLGRARKAGIPAHIICHRDYGSRDAFDKALLEQIDAYQPNLIALAGFMRQLGTDFVARYRGKMINIHPSLLPKYTGLHTHRRTLEAGDKQHGTSIHFVTNDLDAGPMICQASLDVKADDTEDTLKTRIQQLEHKMYPMVLDWFAEERIQLMDHHVEFDGKPLEKSGIQVDLE